MRLLLALVNLKLEMSLHPSSIDEKFCWGKVGIKKLDILGNIPQNLILRV